MEILIYKGKECVTIKAAALSLMVSNPLVYYYIKQGRLNMLCVDHLKLVELDSLILLSDYLAFRYSKNNK